MTMKTLNYELGDVILKEGEESDDAYIILEGEVNVTKKGNHLTTLRKNSIFGEIGLVDSRPRTATCTAKTDVKLGMVTKKNYSRLLKDRPEALNPILKLVVQRMRNLMDFTEQMIDKKT